MKLKPAIALTLLIWATTLLLSAILFVFFVGITAERVEAKSLLWLLGWFYFYMYDAIPFSAAAIPCLATMLCLTCYIKARLLKFVAICMGGSVATLCCFSINRAALAEIFDGTTLVWLQVLCITSGLTAVFIYRKRIISLA